MSTSALGQFSPRLLHTVPYDRTTSVILALVISLAPFLAGAQVKSGWSIQYISNTLPASPSRVEFHPIQRRVFLVQHKHGLVSVWSVESEQPEKLFELDAFAGSAHFSPDGKQLAVFGRDGMLRFWQLIETPTKRLFAKAKPSKVQAVAISSIADFSFSPSGDLLALAGRDGKVYLWSINDSSQRGSPLEGHRGEVVSVAFSPNAEFLASAGRDGNVQIWNVNDGTPRGEALMGHEDWVFSVVFSPRGDVLASAGSGGRVQLWNASDGSPHGASFGGGDAVVSLAFSPSGDLLASSTSSGKVQVWNVNDRSLRVTLQGHRGAVINIAFSPHGDVLASVGSDGKVLLWNVNDGSPRGAPIHGHRGSVTSVAFSPSGDLLASAGRYGKVRLWSVSDGKPSGELLDGHEGLVNSIAFSPQGELLASAGNDGKVQVWRVSDASPRGDPIEGHSGWVDSVAFSPDGELLASAGADGRVMLWNIDDGTLHDDPYIGHEDWVLSVAFSPDGRLLASADYDGKIRLWNVDDGSPSGEPLIEHGSSVTSVAFSPQGDVLASAHYDGSVKLWNVDDGTRRGESLYGHRGPVTGVAFSPQGGVLVSVGRDGKAQLWNVSDGSPRGAPLEGHDDWIFGVSFSPGGELLASAGRDGKLQLWNVNDGTPWRAPLEEQGDWMFGIAISPNGELLASAGQDAKVQLWSITEGGARSGTLVGHNDWVFGVTFSPGGDVLASADYDGKVRLWDVKERSPRGAALEGHQGPVTSIAFSPRGDQLATAGEDGKVQLWDVNEGSPRGAPIEGHRGAVTSVAFSPQGELLASAGSDGKVQVWNVHDRSPRGGPLLGHDNWVFSVKFSPQGELLASAGEDGRVQIWSVEHATPLGAPLKGHRGPVTSIAFSPEGDLLASAGEDGNVLLWNLGNRSSTVVPMGSRVTSLLAVSPSRVWALLAGSRLVAISWDGVVKAEWQFNETGSLAADQYGNISGAGALRRLRIGLDVAHGGVRLGESQLEKMEDIKAINFALTGKREIWEWLYNAINNSVIRVQSRFDSVETPFKHAVWPFILWLVSAIIVFAFWLFKPAVLARLLMPAEGALKLTSPKKIASILTLVQLAGHSKRSLRAWLHQLPPETRASLFVQRRPVLERRHYCDLGSESSIENHLSRAGAEGSLSLWVYGEGGGGKSALAYELARRLYQAGRRTRKGARKDFSPEPILIDEDWTSAPKGGTDGILDYLSDRLRERAHRPTAIMVERLGCWGAFVLVFDAVSERTMPNVNAQLAAALNSAAFPYVIVTSRELPPSAAAFESVTALKPAALTTHNLQEYVDTWAPFGRSDTVLTQLEPLLGSQKQLSPLFIRLAIESAADGPQMATVADVVLHYLDKLAHADPIDEHDLRRAAGLTAYASLNDCRPVEVARQRVQGRLEQEAEIMEYRSSDGETNYTAIQLLKLFERWGLVSAKPRNPNIQFTYDPVAEYLAAHYAVVHLASRGNDTLVREVEAMEGRPAMKKALSDMRAISTKMNMATDVRKCS